SRLKVDTFLLLSNRSGGRVPRNNHQDNRNGADSQVVVGCSCSRGSGTRDQPDIESVAFGVQEAEAVRGIGKADEANRTADTAVCRTDGIAYGFGVRHRAGRASFENVTEGSFVNS